MRRKTSGIIFYIDQQSYANLAMYDYSLLQYNQDLTIRYYGNFLYNYLPVKSVLFIPLFKYSKYKCNKIFSVLSYILSFLTLVKEILRFQPGIIHLQWIKVWWLDYFLLSFSKKIFKTQLIFTAHNILPHNSFGKYYNKYKKVYNIVNAIIVHTHSSKEELIKDFGIDSNKIHVIPHGILSHQVHTKQIEKLKMEFVSQYQLKGRTIFTCIGQQSFYKGTDLLIKAWLSTEKLCNNPECVLFLVGKNAGIDYSEIVKTNNIFIVDRFIEDNEFIAYLQLTDVLLLPYKKISQSGVLLSAINESIPFVVSEVGGLTDPISVAPVGWCIKPNDLESLKNMIVHLMENPDEIKNKRSDKIAWEKVQKFYDWKNISDKTYKLYNSLNN